MSFASSFEGPVGFGARAVDVDVGRPACDGAVVATEDWDRGRSDAVEEGAMDVGSQCFS